MSTPAERREAMKVLVWHDRSCIYDPRTKIIDCRCDYENRVVAICAVFEPVIEKMRGLMLESVKSNEQGPYWNKSPKAIWNYITTHKEQP